MNLDPPLKKSSEANCIPNIISLGANNIEDEAKEKPSFGASPNDSSIISSIPPQSLLPEKAKNDIVSGAYAATMGICEIDDKRKVPIVNPIEMSKASIDSNLGLFQATIEPKKKFESYKSQICDDTQSTIESKSLCCMCHSNEKTLENNQTLQCSTCNLAYHQLCHFVPLFTLPWPLKSWSCLICTYKMQHTEDSSWCVNLNKVYPNQIMMETSVFEKSYSFRFEDKSAELKHDGICMSLKSLKSKIGNSLGQLRSNLHAVEIYKQNASRKAKNRQTIPVELVISFEKMIKFKKICKNLLATLKAYIVSSRPHEPRVEDEAEVAIQEVRCCVCYSGEATDENDVLLCDGEGCFRAMHMKCTTPKVTKEDLEKHPDDNWFCCYCTAFANLIYQVQIGCHEEGEEGHVSEDWGGVEDVFPEIEFEEALAVKMRKALNSNEEVDCIWRELMEGKNVVEIDEESEEDEEDEDFDPDKKNVDIKIAEDDDSVSTYPSNLSLDDVSSVASMSDDELDELHKKSTQKLKEKDKGKIDEENIIEHKRKRAKVDYRKLNDEIFSNVESAIIDDEDEYRHYSERKVTEDGQPRKRGRPRKNPDQVKVSTTPTEGAPASGKRKRGRPRKNPQVESATKKLDGSAENPEHSVTDAPAPAKRKRGRPRKNPDAPAVKKLNTPKENPVISTTFQMLPIHPIDKAQMQLSTNNVQTSTIHHSNPPSQQTTQLSNTITQPATAHDPNTMSQSDTANGNTKINDRNDVPLCAAMSQYPTNFNSTLQSAASNHQIGPLAVVQSSEINDNLENKYQNRS